MRYRLSQIKTSIDMPKEALPEIAAKKLHIDRGEILEWKIRRKSIDSRKKPQIQFVYTIDFTCSRRLRTDRNPNLSTVDEEAESVNAKAPKPGNMVMTERPVIVGAGPCGLFAALELAKAGHRPIVIERGPAMSDRVAAVERFKSERVLDPEANLLFGEGGAGTFSDGKLATGIKDGLVRGVLREFADAGAGEEIMYLARPHIGTDVLRRVIVNIRKKIENLGGEIRFDTRLDSIEIKEGRLCAVKVSKNMKARDSLGEYDDAFGEFDAAGIKCKENFKVASGRIETSALVLAVGHSARDTFSMLKDAGLDMEQKPFSIGVRMEHPQQLIDAAQYGEENLSRVTDAISAEIEPGKLPPADYKLSYKTSSGRGVYSFCMCPGGEVVICSTSDGELCVNGMSSRRRNSGIANSGILCDVRTSDFESDDVLAGVRFQEKYERLAFKNGGGDFIPPRCSMKALLGELYYTEECDRGHDPFDNEDLRAGDEEADSANAVIASLPEFASEAIREALPHFARKIKGYDNPGAIITAVETRSSSPVRILRDEHGESNIKGIYPAGEGAGYAGGITSAACDGIRAAHRVISSQ